MSDLVQADPLEEVHRQWRERWWEFVQRYNDSRTVYHWSDNSLWREDWRQCRPTPIVVGEDE